MAHANFTLSGIRQELTFSPKMLIPAGVLARLSTTRCQVPKDLSSVTSVGEELPPEEGGKAAIGIDQTWRAVERLYRSGYHPAIQLTVRRRGRVVINRAIGHAVGNGPSDGPEVPKILATPDTPFLTFSVSKPVTAMVIHLLDQQGLLHVDDPVCEYIPEFAPHDKHRISIRHLLIHRSGLHQMPPEALTLEHVEDHAAVIKMLCESKPLWMPGRRQAYSVLASGFLLGEIVRRVTGLGIREVHERHVLRPLGFQRMNYGATPGELAAIARSYFTGPPLPGLAARLAREAVGLEYLQAVELCNDPRFLSGVIPSANIIASSNEVSRYFQLLLNEGTLDGVRVFEPRTVRRAVAEQSHGERDGTIRLPMRYSMGFMLGGKRFGLYGPDTEQAFGHMGLMNVLAWADPKRQLAVSLMTSGKPIVYSEIRFLYDILRQLGLAFPATE